MKAEYILIINQAVNFYAFMREKYVQVLTEHI